MDIDVVIYQQNGETWPCDKIFEYFRRYFAEDRVISRRTDHPWLAHCPGLSPFDYFL